MCHVWAPAAGPGEGGGGGGGQLRAERAGRVPGTALHSGATPLLRGCSRKNIFCQKIFDNFFSFQATEMVLTSKSHSQATQTGGR